MLIAGCVRQTFSAALCTLPSSTTATNLSSCISSTVLNHHLRELIYGRQPMPVSVFASSRGRKEDPLNCFRHLTTLCVSNLSSVNLANGCDFGGSTRQEGFVGREQIS